MKKIINYSGIPALILMAALVFLPVSCNKDTVKDNPNADNSSQSIKVSGEDANAATKTTLDGLITSWNAGDKVGIYSPQARTAAAGGGSLIVNAPFTADISGVSSNFTGTMYWSAVNEPHTFYAYYPYAGSAGSSAATAVPVSLATAQTQLEANNSAHIGALDFMVATPVTVTSLANIDPIANTEVSLKYNHLFSILEFQIKGSGFLKAVKLSTNSILAFSGGTINITQTTPTSGTAYTLASLTGTATQCVVTLTNAATLTATNTETKVYMVINPGTQTGNCVIGLSTNGTTWKYITKTALDGGFLRGMKYVVSVDAATAAEATPVTIGQPYQGGIIFYLLVSGDPGYDANVQHGLIAATADQSTGIIWAVTAYQSTSVGTTLGSGAANTDKIIAQNGAGTTYAAGLARAYTGGGYSDWYLPSKDELNKLYLNKTAVGDFASAYYWSSTETDYNSNYAWIQTFDNGYQIYVNKFYTTYMRAIRAF